MRRYGKSEDGSGAAEFALVLPALLLVVFGLIEFGMILYTTTQLHWATEAAARCSAVSVNCKLNGNATGAVSNATVGNYAIAAYKGLAPATFTYDTNGACSRQGTNSANSGHQVSASASFK